ncbi:hypothetical protein [Micromonospora sp. NPDC050200]|uniref:hypothetical protein n=1 Tax=Micromonospora sp. NPDC050200 TaxID=3155664 RepID=UPI0033C2F47C
MLGSKAVDRTSIADKPWLRLVNMVGRRGANDDPWNDPIPDNGGDGKFTVYRKASWPDGRMEFQMLEFSVDFFVKNGDRSPHELYQQDFVTNFTDTVAGANNVLDESTFYSAANAIDNATTWFRSTTDRLTPWVDNVNTEESGFQGSAAEAFRYQILNLRHQMEMYRRQLTTPQDWSSQLRLSGDQAVSFKQSIANAWKTYLTLPTPRDVILSVLRQLETQADQLDVITSFGWYRDHKYNDNNRPHVIPADWSWDFNITLGNNTSVYNLADPSQAAALDFAMRWAWANNVVQYLDRPALDVFTQLNTAYQAAYSTMSLPITLQQYPIALNDPNNPNLPDKDDPNGPPDLDSGGGGGGGNENIDLGGGGGGGDGNLNLDGGGGGGGGNENIDLGGGGGGGDGNLNLDGGGGGGGGNENLTFDGGGGGGGGLPLDGGGGPGGNENLTFDGGGGGGGGGLPLDGGGGPGGGNNLLGVPGSDGGSSGLPDTSGGGSGLPGGVFGPLGAPGSPGGSPQRIGRLNGSPSSEGGANDFTEPGSGNRDDPTFGGGSTLLNGLGDETSVNGLGGPTPIGGVPGSDPGGSGGSTLLNGLGDETRVGAFGGGSPLGGVPGNDPGVSGGVFGGGGDVRSGIVDTGIPSLDNSDLPPVTSSGSQSIGGLTEGTNNGLNDFGDDLPTGRPDEFGGGSSGLDDLPDTSGVRLGDGSGNFSGSGGPGSDGGNSFGSTPYQPPSDVNSSLATSMFPTAGGQGTPGTNGMNSGMPFMPPMGGMGQPNANQDKDRERSTWLVEDEDVWGTDPTCAPAVIGRGDNTDFDAIERGEWEPAPAASPATTTERSTPNAERARG